MNSAARAARSTLAHRRVADASGAATQQPATNVRRPDRRSARTIEKIVGAARDAMLDYGSAKLSVSEVCEKAGVSRGTLYRYFASIEEVLQAVAMQLRTETDEELRQALDGHDDPKDRFTAFLAYTGNSRETERGAHFLHVEPEFVLRYFDQNFGHFIARVNNALETVYDAWERDLGQKLDREAISEMMVRFALSETLIRTPKGQTPLPDRLRAMVDLVLRHRALAR